MHALKDWTSDSILSGARGILEGVSNDPGYGLTRAEKIFMDERKGGGGRAARG
jgi:hypothetical protein